MSEEVRAAVIEGLAEGKSLSEICKHVDMPNRSTIQRWQEDDRDFDAAVTRAREIGYLARADKAVEEAKAAPDASLGRLAFDAERWYLGKLSNAFSDKQRVEHSGNVTLGAALDALDADAA